MTVPRDRASCRAMSIRASRVELRMRCRRPPGSASRRSTPGDSHAESLVVAGSSIVVGGVYGRPFANTRSRRQGARGQVGSCSRPEHRSDEGNGAVALVDDPGGPKETGGREGRETGATRAEERRRREKEGGRGSAESRRGEEIAEMPPDHRPERSAEAGDAIDPAATSSG